MRYKNIEFRRAGVADSNGHTTSLRDPEIVAWMQRDDDKETCYTICWFKECKEDWYMETVGNRFTEYEEEYPLIHVARYALRVLNLEKQFHEGCY
jgi:hypothetical protein